MIVEPHSAIGPTGPAGCRVHNRATLPATDGVVEASGVAIDPWAPCRAQSSLHKRSLAVPLGGVRVGLADM